jgi:hypothetical protein
MNSNLLQADALAQQGDWREAVEQLCATNKRAPSVSLERKLVDWRLQAHRALSWPVPSSPWAGEWEESRASKPGIYEINASDFNARTLAKGVLGHGALIVRGLISTEAIDYLKECIENSIKARENEGPTDDSPWNYRSPYITGEPTKFATKSAQDAEKRAKVKKGSIWVAESPRTMQRLIELYGEIGMREVLSEYFGEAPSLSVRKWVLRKIEPIKMSTGWHQDGRFMGTDFHSVNLWLPLSECGEGTKAAGIELIPTPTRQILETGTRGAPFQWTVGNDIVEELTHELPICLPHFSPGDALFFDHYNLHRTEFGEHLTEPRYAVENWFFASSSIPAKQMPIFF